MKEKMKYISRELSWLDFNDRVLEEAYDERNPLLEQLKFLAITGSNLDEFFMVRVAELKSLSEHDPRYTDAAGMTMQQLYPLVCEKIHDMNTRQYACFDQLKGKLEKEGVLLRGIEELSPELMEEIQQIFEEKIYPVLTPIAIDQTRPFPLLQNRSVYLGVTLIGREQTEDCFAAVQVPAILSRFVSLSDGALVLLEDLIASQVSALFPGYQVLNTCPFRITRDSDLDIDEETGDFMMEMERSISRRKWGAPVRLEIASKPNNDYIRTFLKEQLGITEREIYEPTGLLDLSALMKLTKLEGFSRLNYEPRPPQTPLDIDPDEDIFKQIAERDRLVFLPYESFDCVVEFIKQAARDPKVLAIKQTLYRVSGNSPIISALIEAAQNGKQVTVLVELKARFDEENNINWAKHLEQAGCHVIYGLSGLKIHCKVLLVVRRENDGIRRYLHLGTGNYNDSTAKLYTDMGLFTCKERYGADASTLFNLLTGYAAPQSWRKLAVAPTHLRDFFIGKIDEEIENARLSRPCGIWAKMNSLIDEEIIARLYKASQAGVPVNLIVRGMCSLIPGIPGVSENIHVRSIVGRYLEHSRIFRFENGGKPCIYMGSADWMPRNLDRRVEVVFPVEDEALADRLWHILLIELSDNTKAREMSLTGEYTRVQRGNGAKISAQDYFYEEIAREHRKNKEENKQEVFRPKFSMNKE